MGERALHDGSHAGDRWPDDASERDERRLDPRARSEHGRWHSVKAGLSRRQLNKTDTAPYAFVRGTAKNRSATSRCTITHQCSRNGVRSRVSTTSGVAMLYGRFATSFRGCGSRAPRSRASASAKISRTFSWALRGREGLLERTVDLHGMHETDARREVAREDSKAGADLQHDVVPP